MSAMYYLLSYGYVQLETSYCESSSMGLQIKRGVAMIVSTSETSPKKGVEKAPSEQANQFNHLFPSPQPLFPKRVGVFVIPSTRRNGIRRAMIRPSTAAHKFRT
jgi:hypothetical protein